MNKRKSILKNQKGMATIESVPILVLFLVLISYGIGLWSYVHTNILHSVSARTYVFETLRNRTNYNFFRDDGSTGWVYSELGFRYHFVTSDKITTSSDDVSEAYATERVLAFGRNLATVEQSRGSEEDHNVNIHTIGQQYRGNQSAVPVNPAWVMVGYGICLDARCGGN